MRVSNFLLWQIAYAEIWVTDVLWPDFRCQHLLDAILDYQKRDRRYGGINPSQVAASRVGRRTPWSGDPRPERARPDRGRAGPDLVRAPLAVPGDPGRGARAGVRRVRGHGRQARPRHPAGALGRRGARGPRGNCLAGGPARPGAHGRLSRHLLSGVGHFQPGPTVPASAAASLFPALYLAVPLGTMAAVRTTTGARACCSSPGDLGFRHRAVLYRAAVRPPPLAPAISPKKTVEGAVGGFAAGVAATVRSAAGGCPASGGAGSPGSARRSWRSASSATCSSRC